MNVRQLHNKATANMTKTELVRYMMDNGKLLFDIQNKESVTVTNDLFKINKQVENTECMNAYLSNIHKEPMMILQETEDYRCCGTPMQQDDISFTCFTCGNTIEDYISYEVDYTRMSIYTKTPYVRRNYFKNTLDKLFGHKYVNIPEYDRIKEHIELNKIKKITYKNLHNALFKLDMKHHFHNIGAIKYKLTGKNIIDIDPQQVELLLDEMIIVEQAFHTIQEESSSMKKRKYFLNLYYIIFKLFQRNNIKNIDCIPKTKLAKNLINNNLIWCDICRHLGWKFT